MTSRCCWNDAGDAVWRNKGIAQDGQDEQHGDANRNNLSGLLPVLASFRHAHPPPIHSSRHEDARLNPADHAPNRVLSLVPVLKYQTASPASSGKHQTTVSQSPSAGARPAGSTGLPPPATRQPDARLHAQAGCCKQVASSATQSTRGLSGYSRAPRSTTRHLPPSLLRSHRQIQYRSIGTTLKTASPPLCSLFSQLSRRRLVQELIVTLDSSFCCKAASSWASSRSSQVLLCANRPIDLVTVSWIYLAVDCCSSRHPTFSFLIIPGTNVSRDRQLPRWTLELDPKEQ